MFFRELPIATPAESGTRLQIAEGCFLWKGKPNFQAFTVERRSCVTERAGAQAALFLRGESHGNSMDRGAPFGVGLKVLITWLA